MQNELYGLTVGATLACGTGACAVVVAAVLEGRAERVCLSFLSACLLFWHFTHIHYSLEFMLYLNLLSFYHETEMCS